MGCSFRYSSSSNLYSTASLAAVRGLVRLFLIYLSFGLALPWIRASLTLAQQLYMQRWWVLQPRRALLVLLEHWSCSTLPIFWARQTLNSVYSNSSNSCPTASLATIMGSAATEGSYWSSWTLVLQYFSYMSSLKVWLRTSLDASVDEDLLSWSPCLSRCSTHRGFLGEQLSFNILLVERFREQLLPNLLLENDDTLVVDPQRYEAVGLEETLKSLILYENKQDADCKFISLT